jgi:hypothetical protein
VASRPKENLVAYTKVNFAGRPIYQIGISFFKVALLISYLRLLQGTTQRTYRAIVYVTMVLVFLAHLGCAFSLIFACTPVRSPSSFCLSHCRYAGLTNVSPMA